MPKKFYPAEQLTAEERDALERFALVYGRTWKAKLMNAWWDGKDAQEPNGHLLRRIRNRLGPSWLAEIPSNVNLWG